MMLEMFLSRRMRLNEKEEENRDKDEERRGDECVNCGGRGGEGGWRCE